MKALKIIALVLVGLWAAGGLLIWVAGSLSRFTPQSRSDAAHAVNAAEVVAKALHDDPELKLKFGNLLRISGEGYHRPGAWVLIERIELNRVAEFERGTVSVNIVVPDSGPSAAERDEWSVSQWRLGMDDTARNFLEVWVGPKAVAVSSSQASRDVTSVKGPISCVALSSGAGRIFVSRTGTVEVWDAKSCKMLREISGFHGYVNAMETSADGARLALACDNQSVQVYDITNSALTGTASWHARGDHPVALSRDGSLLVAPFFKMTSVVQIGVATHLSDDAKTLLLEPEKGVNAALGMWLSPDGKYAIATSEQGRKVRVWDVMTGEARTLIELDTTLEGGQDLIFTPRSGRLISCPASRVPKPVVWEIPSGKKLMTLEGAPQNKNSSFFLTGHAVTAVSADESLLALGFFDGPLFVWDMVSNRYLGEIGEKQWTLEGSVSNTSDLAWEQVRGIYAYHGISGAGIKKPAKPLVALGFDSENRIVGISLTDRVCWIWSAKAPQPKAATSAAVVSRDSAYVVEAKALLGRAQNGDTWAQKRLSWMYAYGNGVPKNESESLKWLRTAAEQGDVEAQWQLGRNYRLGFQAPKDPVQAQFWLHKAIERNHPEAQWQLACMYRYGQGVAKDAEEAARWYRRAADQNHVSSQHALGQMYDEGDGVPKDESEAVRWFQRAALLNYYASQFSLGNKYATGSGIAKDPVQASVWLSLSVRNGYKVAAESLQRVERDMVPEQKSEAARLADELFEKIRKKPFTSQKKAVR